MKRREFLTKSGVRAAEGLVEASADPVATPGVEAVSPFANKSLPKVARTTAGLEPYTGTWGPDQTAHLLRRTIFGANVSDLQSVSSLTLDQLLDQLLADTPVPDPPVNTATTDTGVPVGQTWVTAAKINPDGSNPNGTRISELKSWWVGLMLSQGISLREKMTLFWHNHFVTETNIVNDARYCYQYNALLRQYALGNWKTLAEQVTINPAMLVYLNGNTNTKTSPNENYGRELQELFTIGKGPEVSPGDYTNYTEADVQAAAKVLTGWRDSSANINSFFTLSRHDTTNKQFSPDYGSTVIAGSSDPGGMVEIDALLAMIFGEAATAKFICRKLYRWFVYYLIDSTVETNVIEPMADILRANNYEIKPALRALLRSAHFFDPVNVGCLIKNPADFTVGLCRQFSIPFPDATQLTAQYNMWKYLRTQAANFQQDLGDPPNVAGWPAYYQAPQFHELWINSDTLPKRNQYSDTLIGAGFKQSGYTLAADPIAFATGLANPEDPNLLISQAAAILFPIAITDNQKTFLKGVLIPGLPDYEWSTEWYTYLSDTSNAANKAAVKSKLQALFKFMMDMAEYQLM